VHPTVTDTVLVAGGNGRLGRRVLEAFDRAGYRTANASRGERREAVADRYVRADLLDAGEAYGALAAVDPDAVVHAATLTRPGDAPEHVVFGSNALTTYHVLAAADALDVGRVVLASSMSAMGASFEPDPARVEYLPVDEAHPLTPTTSYGTGKRVMETVGDGFGRRPDGPTVVSLRFPWVTDDRDLRETFLDADRTPAGLRESGFYAKARNTLFAYLHADDAVRAVRRAVEADVAGGERVWLAAADTSADVPSDRLAREVYPDAERRKPLEGYRSLVDTSKAERLLDWTPTRSWRALAGDGE
jgi:nucleoside-diphosphate-sugar epimerase